MPTNGYGFRFTNLTSGTINGGRSGVYNVILIFQHPTDKTQVCGCIIHDHDVRFVFALHRNLPQVYICL